jgi:4-hydroxy-3-polyprenylbenzoate decarboxylase
MRLVIGMTGASGAIYGIRLLEALQAAKVETHLILSKWAQATITIETTYSISAVKALATWTHPVDNQAAAIASGSFLTAGMAIVPCSMRTLAAIRAGLADNLLTRAADVAIKERRRLVLVPRETPLSEIHLENMLVLTRMGVVMLPPMPAFYLAPQSIEDLVQHTVARILDQFGIENQISPRWETVKKAPAPDESTDI